MTLGTLTEIVQNLYLRGVVKSTNVELTNEVIQAYLRTAYGAVIQSIADKKQRQGDSDYSYTISGAVKTETITLEKSGNKSTFNLSEFNVMKLDKGMDIVSFEQPAKYDSCVGGNVLTITPVTPFEVKFYLVNESKSEYFYVRTGLGGTIYNLPDCLKELNISFVDADAEADLPEDVCINMCKIAFPDIFGVKKFEKTKIDDNSNEMVHQLKLQIAASNG